MNSPGRHRHPGTVHLGALAALIIAVVAGAVMLTVKPTDPQPAAGGALDGLSAAYPGSEPVPVPRQVEDGSAYSPLFFVTAEQSVGVAASADGAVRLLLRTPGGETELRRLPREENPEYGGFVSDGERLAWLELTAGPDGLGRNALWTATLADSEATELTTDTGQLILFDKRDDLVLHDDAVSWVSAAPSDDPAAPPVTEIRTVSLDGGPVQVEQVEGGWVLAGWPWLVSVGTGGLVEPVELRNLRTLERLVVGVQPSELMTCSPVWCRALIIGGSEQTTVIELLTTDGRTRLRSATGQVGAALADVALLDRYEVYIRSPGQLLLFDLEREATTVIAEGAQQVVARHGMLWWATGNNETTQWYVLDLRTLDEAG